MCTPGGLLDGRCLIRCAPRRCRCKHSTKQLCALRKQRAWFTIQTTADKQYVSIVYNERLAEHGIAASTGAVGDSYDNVLAENVNGSYKNELIRRRSWNDVVDVEIATFEWVNWWNESRLHQSLGYRTPAEVEAKSWEHHPSQEIMEIKANAWEQNPGHFTSGLSPVNPPAAVPTTRAQHPGRKRETGRCQ